MRNLFRMSRVMPQRPFPPSSLLDEITGGQGIRRLHLVAFREQWKNDTFHEDCQPWPGYCINGLHKCARNATSDQYQHMCVTSMHTACTQEHVLSLQGQSYLMHGRVMHMAGSPLKTGSNNSKRWAACWATEQRGEIILCESGIIVPLLTSAASAPWRPSHAGAGMLHTKFFPRQ